MRALGIDYGERRIGLAYGDELGVSMPLPAANQPQFEERMRHIAETIASRRIDRLVVGYPYNMDGSAGFKAREVDAFIAVLEKRFSLPVARVDETLTSVAAEEGIPGKRKRGLAEVRRLRATGEIDSRAAAIFLQEYLDSQMEIPPPDLADYDQ